MGVCAIKKHVLPWSFVGFCLIVGGCDKEVGEGSAKRSNSWELLSPDNNSALTDSDSSQRNLTSPTQASSIRRVPFDCKQEGLVKKGGCWGQCIVSSGNPNKCEPRKIAPPCASLPPDQCWGQNNNGKVQCFVDSRGPLPQQGNMRAAGPGGNATAYYEDKCVNLSAVPDCRMKSLAEIDNECSKQTTKDDCEKIAANNEKACVFTNPKPASCTLSEGAKRFCASKWAANANGQRCNEFGLVGHGVENNKQALLCQVSGAGYAVGGGVGRCELQPNDACTAVFDKYANGNKTQPFCEGIRMARNVTAAAPNGAGAGHTHEFHAGGGGGVNDRVRTSVRISYSGPYTCKFKDPTPGECHAKPASDWTVDPCQTLTPAACQQASDLCQFGTASQMPPELTQPIQP